MQRLRQIYQLQSARWVYPSAEHSRFQHSLGAMHLAGRFARHLYPSLKAAARDCPSEHYVEEVLRVAALLHDVGHGPFGHFFDDNYLEQFGLTHEKLGQHIIKNELGEIIRSVRRSPSGEFHKGERLNPEQIAFLIGKGPSSGGGGKQPRWLQFLQPMLSGIYTVDNLDYVLRDAYMCGVAVGAVDIDRLMYYSFFTEKGLTLHKSGLSALNMFLNARLYMYTNVYYHRTTRAIDEHLKELFKETMAALFPLQPRREPAGIPGTDRLVAARSGPALGQEGERGNGQARHRVGSHPFPRSEMENGLRRNAFDAVLRKGQDHHRRRGAREAHQEEPAAEDQGPCSSGSIWRARTRGPSTRS